MATDILTDEAIAQTVAMGDAESFGILVERYEQKLLRYASRFLFGVSDAQDLVQNVFMKAYVNIKSFDVKRKFSSWIYRIAHNEFVNALKRRSREPFLFFDADVLFPHPLSAETADRALNEKELRISIDSCLKELTPKYREVLSLYYFEDMDYRDIADVLHIPVPTVGVRLRRARIALKRSLDKKQCL